MACPRGGVVPWVWVEISRPDSRGSMMQRPQRTRSEMREHATVRQGQVVPAEFIGMVASQQKTYLAEEPVSNHDELMCEGGGCAVVVCGLGEGSLKPRCLISAHRSTFVCSLNGGEF